MSRPKLGDIVQIDLPNGRYAFGRVLRDASIGIYREVANEPADAPIGSRDYVFVVGIYDDALRRLRVVAHDPGASEDEDWPPLYEITDPITGRRDIYERGDVRPAKPSDPANLEPAAVWDLHHIIARIETGSA
jgi:Immunity protein 26